MLFTRAILDVINAIQQHFFYSYITSIYIFYMFWLVLTYFLLEDSWVYNDINPLMPNSDL